MWYVVFCPSVTRRQGLEIFVTVLFAITVLTVILNKAYSELRNIVVGYFWIAMLKDTIIPDLRRRGLNIPNWIDQPLQSIKTKLSKRFGGNRNP